MMTIQHIKKRATTIASAILFTSMSLQSALAAPGTLATGPLFLSTSIEPNVFFTIDDSGSMGWGLMVQDGGGHGFTTSNGVPNVDGRLRYYYNTDWYNEDSVLPPYANTPLGWTMLNHQFNKNYFNPAITYTPWAGTKANGDPMFADADATAAVFHPVNNTTTTSNLTTAKTHGGDPIYLPTYFKWADNGDGVPQAAEGQKVEIVAGTDEMQNFANWFVYYRERELASKAAIGRVINGTDATRMGFNVFNANVHVDVESMTDPASKRVLLEKYYGITSGNGTPARRSLQRTGKYFEETGTNAPILTAGGECQQNFNIMMTDGFWNGSSPSGIGNADSNGSGPFDGNAAQSNDGGNYADNHSKTLADVAMHYYENDLRDGTPGAGGLANRVPTTTGVDEADHQHLVTYTIAFGLKGDLDLDVDPTALDFPGWPKPVANNPSTIDDLLHAAYNGRGKYLNAQNPDELETALNASVADIAERTATAAAVSINSATLTEDTAVYRAEFNSNRWQGSLFAFKFATDPVTQELVSPPRLATTPTWEAGDVLDSRNIASNPRVILTHNGLGGVPFRWDNTYDLLSAEQKNDLRASAIGGIDPDETAKARLEYLRGSRVDENTGKFFRERASLLGDIVNSGPVFVGEPRLNWPDTAPFPTAYPNRYSDFKNSSVKNRTGMIYVGANDGMLHGFEQSAGEERLAYIPGNLFSSNIGEGMHYLTEPNYVHKYYTDLSPSVSDIYINGAWKTVLIGGERGGGRGLFALDVTNPSNFTDATAANVAMWEFTDADDADLGHTYSRPQIARTNAGSWVAIFGNGYNHTGDGEAKLFILKIDEGLDGNWAGGYVKIATPSAVSAADSLVNPNGLATPALADLDGNGTVDRVYAGDLTGRMWAFDLSSTDFNQWGIAHGSSPLFVTQGSRPITTQPALSKHPTISTIGSTEPGSNVPNVMVYFGTGQYLVDSDNTTNADNYFYGIWDKGDGNSFVQGKLAQQFITASTFTDVNGETFQVRENSRNSVNYAGGEYGWFFKLSDPKRGERSIFGPVLRGGVIFFNTFVPDNDPCSVGGSGWQMVVDIINGGSPTSPQFDTNNDGIVDEHDKLPTGGVVSGVSAEGIIPKDSFVEEVKISGDKEEPVPPLKKLQTGRFSWQELLR